MRISTMMNEVLDYPAEERAEWLETTGPRHGAANSTTFPSTPGTKLLPIMPALLNRIMKKLNKSIPYIGIVGGCILNCLFLFSLGCTSQPEKIQGAFGMRFGEKISTEKDSSVELPFGDSYSFLPQGETYGFTDFRVFACISSTGTKHVDVIRASKFTLASDDEIQTEMSRIKDLILSQYNFLTFQYSVPLHSWLGQGQNDDCGWVIIKSNQHGEIILYFLSGSDIQGEGRHSAFSYMSAPEITSKMFFKRNLDIDFSLGGIVPGMVGAKTIRKISETEGGDMYEFSPDENPMEFSNYFLTQSPKTHVVNCITAVKSFDDIAAAFGFAKRIFYEYAGILNDKEAKWDTDQTEWIVAQDVRFAFISLTNAGGKYLVRLNVADFMLRDWGNFEHKIRNKSLMPWEEEN